MVVAFPRTTDLLIAWAFQNLILGTTLDDGSPITPHAPVVRANQGDTDVDVGAANTGNFSAGGLMTFYDQEPGTRAEEPKISEEWDEVSNPIPLDYTGRRERGLQATHTGSVGSGLYLDAPDNLDHMVTRDHTLIFLTVTRQRDYASASFDQIEPNFSVRLEMRVSGQQQRPVGPDRKLMDPNTWSFDQRQRGREAMVKINDAFNDHYTLMTDHGEVALGRGDPTNATGEVWSVDWQPVVVTTNSGNVVQFAAVVNTAIRGKWRYINI